MPLALANTRCLACNGRMDAFGYHALTCREGTGRIFKHDGFTVLTKRLLDECGIESRSSRATSSAGTRRSPRTTSP